MAGADCSCWFSTVWRHRIGRQEWRHYLHDTNTENGEESNFIAWSRLQPVDHRQRKKQHQDVDDDVDDGDSGIASDLVATGAIYSRIPILLDWSADQESDQYGHNEPAGLETDDDPGHDLYGKRVKS